MSRWYILDEDNNPVACSGGIVDQALKYEEWRKAHPHQWQVEKTTTVTGVEVSTVFLGLDHRTPFFEGDPPVLWETMAFNCGEDSGEFQRRYTTYTGAVKGHWKAVEEFGGLAPQKTWQKIVTLFKKGIGRCETG